MKTDSAPPPAATNTDSPPSPPIGPAWNGGGTDSLARRPEQVVGAARQRQRTTVATRPTPLPKRPKGRWFVGLILLGICSLLVHSVWETFLRYSAYGTIAGRVIDVGSPWAGIVRAVHVKEGDQIEPGQLLVSLEDLQLQQQLERIGDELQIAQATLRSELAKLEYQSQLQGDRTKKALAEYFELWGKLLQERATLDEYESRLTRAQQLKKRDVVTREELQSLEYKTIGQRAKVSKLKDAVKEMKERVDLHQNSGVTGRREFEPQLAQIESLQAELTRLRKNLEQGKVISPTAGRVLAIQNFAGESVGPAEVVLELLEQSSTQGVIYLRQTQAERLQQGDEIELSVRPIDQLVRFRVTRIGTKLLPAPSNLAKYYRENELLLPVYLEPDSQLADDALRLGAEIRLPSGWPNLRKMWQDITSFWQ